MHHADADTSAGRGVDSPTGPGAHGTADGQTTERPRPAWWHRFGKRTRPGQIDPEAAPQAGSAPHPGSPYPLGSTPDHKGTNFAVVADGRPGVTDVLLCLVEPDGRERRVEMTERTYGIWHCFVPGVSPGQRYGFRVPARDPAKILLDPHARRLSTTDYRLDVASTPGLDSLGHVPLAVVTGPAQATKPHPRVPWEQTVIYETHLAGLTRRHPQVPAEVRGTYLGAAHPAVIEHLRSLNITALELLPVQASTAEPMLQRAGLRNYWGYSTLGFFAPHPAYAAVPGNEIDEFITLADALHDAGIELILDVVYNHTCEGGHGLTADLCWRGLAPDSYYLPGGRDITGTGNTLDAGQLPVIRMVTDSLRYWAETMGVDGFRFDLASVLGRPRGGPFDPAAALLSAIAADPVLSECKLIAEPWDATSEGYATGGFGPNWSEWNDKFRDTVRDFWRGAAGVRDLGYRLTGSSDLFAPSRRPWASINFVTAHDGFTLRDLVSYDRKHNEANGEDNRDGSDNNRSCNYGVEGPTDDPHIAALRTRQARNLAATLLLSTGTPMITMGDELWRTQRGNNNPYSLDNEISWVDWDPLQSPGPARNMLTFFRHALAIRRNAPGLRQAEFFDGRSPEGGDGVPDLVWFAPDGRQMTDQDWFDDTCRTLMMWINGRDVRGHTRAGDPLSDYSWLLVLHADAQPASLVLPGPPYGTDYLPMLDTDTETGVPASDQPVPAGEEVNIPGRTVWLLRARRTAAAEHAGEIRHESSNSPLR